MTFKQFCYTWFLKLSLQTEHFISQKLKISTLCTYSTSANICTDLLQFRYLTACALVHKLLQKAPKVLQS